MTNDFTFIDFDGVILDSEERMLERKYNLGLHDHKNESEFDTYFEYTNLHPEEWEYILKEAKSINNSVEIIKELESLKKNIAILSTHFIDEAIELADYIHIIGKDGYYKKIKNSLKKPRYKDGKYQEFLEFIKREYV